MVSQYLHLCQEEDFEPLSRATMCSCPQAGCSLSFTSFDSLQSHLDYEQHEIKTSQESIYDQFRRDFLLSTRRIVPNQRCKFPLWQTVVGHFKNQR